MAKETLTDSKGPEASISAGDALPSTNNGKPAIADTDAGTGSETKGRGRRKSDRPIPACTFRDALAFAEEIYRYNSGNAVIRVSLLDHLGKGQSSSITRDLIAGTAKYGLIIGNYSSEKLDLTQDARAIVGEGTPPASKAALKVKHAIEHVDVFRQLYESYKGKILPAQQAIKDHLVGQGVPSEWLDETVDMFVDNTKFVGLLRVLSGAERVITIEHLIEEAPTSEGGRVADGAIKQFRANIARPLDSQTTTDFSRTCFYVTPIGAEGSESRQHSDLYLNHIISPALADTDLIVVRADQINDSGIITRQIIEHIVRSRLVIADLSFHNPNVFYELALRHACRLPTVQIIRQVDPIPFDLNQVRTIQIDDSSIYSLIPQLETYKSEIASQVRKALADDHDAHNPVSIYFPGLLVTLPESNGPDAINGRGSA